MEYKTITLFGKVYAATSRGAVESLFRVGRTVNGTYRLVSGGIVLRDLTGAPRALLTRRDGCVVTAHKEGRATRYMYGLTQADATYLNAPQSLSEQHSALVTLFTEEG